MKKKKRKDVFEIDNNSLDINVSASEDIAPKKTAKKEVLKKKKKKKPAKKKECSFKINKEKKERLKLLEDVKRKLEGKTNREDMEMVKTAKTGPQVVLVDHEEGPQLLSWGKV
eukprot:4285358-Ditylum_brightwellii.AAC.1